MDASLKLASAGDDIKLWDCNGYSLVKQFNPHSDNVQSIAWSHDNSSLVSASTAGDKIVVSFCGSGDYNVTLSDKEAHGRTCVAFCSNSRFVVGGGADSAIYVWDLKTKKLKKEYKGLKGSITTLQFNYNDTVIASGSESGEIMLYNVVTGIGYMPLTTPKLQAVRQLQYSYHKKTLLGSVSDDGATYLWDTNTKRLLHSFDGAHKAPASGLAFSPFNDMLLLSVGLDKKIVCYDVQNRKIVKTLIAESALTSVDIFRDGSTLAVGSSRGKVYIYDLRQGANAISVTSAHKTSVSCLQFQKNVNTFEDAETGGHSLTSSSSFTKPTLLNNNNNSNLNSSSRLSSSLNNRERSLPPPACSPANSNIAKATSEQDLHINGGMAVELGDMFSPIRDIYPSYVPKTSDVIVRESDSSKITSPANDALGLPTAGSYRSVGHIDTSANVFSPLSISGQQASNLMTEKPGCQTVVGAIDSTFTESERSLPPKVGHNIGHSTGLASVPSLITPPDAAPSFEVGLEASASASSSKEELVSGVPSSSAIPASSSFQLEFILNSVRDVMDDFQEQIRQDVLNLHVEMLKQFQIQQMEIKKLLETYSMNSDLLAEIQRLREENARLKKNY